MTTRPCPSCNAPIGQEDAFCPRCGSPATMTAAPKRNVKWLWILVGLVLLCPGAIVGIGILATLIVPNVMEKFRHAGAEKAETDIAALVNALNEYAIRNRGRYPESLEALVTPDDLGYRYLSSTELPRDPWGRGYHYAPPDAENPDPRVWSFGKDGAPGGDDDVESWTMDEGR